MKYYSVTGGLSSVHQPLNIRYLASNYRIKLLQVLNVFNVAVGTSDIERRVKISASISKEISQLYTVEPRLDDHFAITTIIKGPKQISICFCVKMFH